MSPRTSLITRYDSQLWLSSSGALPNYRAWYLYFVNQSTSRYDNSVMNNICAVGIVRAYLSSRVYILNNRGSHTGYWLSRAAIIIWEFADIAISACSMLFFVCSNVCILDINFMPTFRDFYIFTEKPAFCCREENVVASIEVYVTSYSFKSRYLIQS